MYNHLTGNITRLTPSSVVIDCNGVGYALSISSNCYAKINGQKMTTILTHLQVSEDAHVLYGFHDEQERRLFRHLLSVSGIGAKTAMAIVSSSSPDTMS